LPNYYYEIFLTASNLHVFGSVKGGRINKKISKKALFPSYNSASTATPLSRLGSSGL
jgi:hypothetical protein